MHYDTAISQGSDDKIVLPTSLPLSTILLPLPMMRTTPTVIILIIVIVGMGLDVLFQVLRTLEFL